MKTYSIKTKEVTREWYVLDAAEAPLGRLSTLAASLLIGKGKPTLSKHIDGGDYVIVINADKLVVTGGKTEKKVYYRHSGFPGGIKSRTLKEQQTKDSTRVIYTAIRGMLPVNKLRSERLARLKIYDGDQHAHSGQNPKNLSLKKEGK